MSPLVRILSQTNSVDTSPSYFISWRSILMLHNRLCFGLPRGFLPSGFPSNNFYAFLFSPIRATCPADPILHDLIILILLDEEYKSHNSSLRSFLHPPVTSYLSGLRIFINTLSLYSSLNVREQVSHPYRTTGKITVLYILIFKFLEIRQW
jgi:hypothetical protein